MVIPNPTKSMRKENQHELRVSFLSRVQQHSEYTVGVALCVHWDLGHFITAALEKKCQQQGCSSLPYQLSQNMCSGSGSWTRQQAVGADAKLPRDSSPLRAELYLAIPQTHGGGR